MKITIETKTNKYIVELPEGITLDEIYNKINLLLLLVGYFPSKSGIENSANEFNDIMNMLYEDDEDDYKKLKQIEADLENKKGVFKQNMPLFKKQIEDNLENKRLNNIKLAENGVI
jgi:hypothetical protein